MRLFLSSYRAGNYPSRLIDLFGHKSKVAVITNAKDYKNSLERKISVEESLSFFADLGMKPEEIDLRAYFNKPQLLEKRIKQYQTFWLAGGNTFLLRRALKQTGLDKLLYDRVRKNEIVYGGESAGAIIAGPTLRGSEDNSTDEDDPNFIPKPYTKKIIWDGLDFVSYVPVPHYKSPDYSNSIDNYVKYLQAKRLPYKTMKEEEAIIINGDKEEFLR